jgi:porphobilinogen synthase
VRELVAESRLSVSDLILPLFIQEGTGQTTPIDTMPGVYRYTIDQLIPVVKEAKALGIPAIAIFPATPSDKKTPQGKEALNPKNLVCTAIRAIRKEVDGIGIIADVALDPYTDHGQDGVLDSRGYVDNDATLEILCKQAVIQAAAGCDMVAPSDMMDGRVIKIREALDKQGYTQVRILSYAAKYASHFYGPFRDAVGSKGSLGSKGKHDYQMDSRNGAEALRETAFDIEEGADMVMVKPGMPYLDIIYRIKQAFTIPVFAYQVSGEYAMLRAAGDRGMLDFEKALEESLIAFKRAGADAIITYAALDVARRLKKS